MSLPIEHSKQMAQATRPTEPVLGTVLVVGGCGFLGYYLIAHFLRDEECGPVHAFDRDIANNVHDGAAYTRGEITDAQALSSLVEKIRPTVIIHSASPVVELPSHRTREYHDTNIKGTQILLTIAAETDSVKALVYTSTVDAYTDPPHDDVDETHPLWESDAKTSDYSRTKAIADRMVREANGPKLRTVAIRPGHIYGERHKQGLVQVLDLCSGNQKLIQVGSGKNMMEVVSGDNVAAAHVLAAKALIDPARAPGRIDGEGFNISDGVPVPFWHHIRTIWKEARGDDALKSVIVLPAWIMIAVVYFLDWVLWLFTFDTVKPPQALSKLSLSYCLYTHTYSIRKARECLGFEPVADHDALVAQSVRWELERRSKLNPNTRNL